MAISDNGKSITIANEGGDNLVIDYKDSGVFWEDGAFIIDYANSSFNSTASLREFITEHLDEIRQDMRSIMSERIQKADGDANDSVTYNNIEDVRDGVTDEYSDVGSQRANNQNLVTALGVEALYQEALALKTDTESGNTAYDHIAEAASGHIARDIKDEFLRDYGGKDLTLAVTILRGNGIETAINDEAYSIEKTSNFLLQPMDGTVFQYSGIQTRKFVIDNEAAFVGRLKTIVREATIDEDGQFSAEKLAEIERQLEVGAEKADLLGAENGGALALLNATGLKLVEQIKDFIAQNPDASIGDLIASERGTLDVSEAFVAAAPEKEVAPEVNADVDAVVDEKERVVEASSEPPAETAESPVEAPVKDTVADLAAEPAVEPPILENLHWMDDSSCCEDVRALQEALAQEDAFKARLGDGCLYNDGMCGYRTRGVIEDYALAYGFDPRTMSVSELTAHVQENLQVLVADRTSEATGSPLQNSFNEEADLQSATSGVDKNADLGENLDVDQRQAQNVNLTPNGLNS